MKVLYTFPPLYRILDDKFKVRGRPVIFTFGPVIHNPGRIKITPELMAHEEVHSHRQGAHVDAWWQDYLNDPRFRLIEELPAHIAEYGCFCARVADHKPQQRALHLIADRLSSPFYGSLLDYGEARIRIADGAQAVGQQVSAP